MLEVVSPLWHTLVGEASPFVERVDLAYGALAAVVAITINARIALLAPLLVNVTEAALRYYPDLNPVLIDAVPFLVVIFVILGALQALITAIAGREAAAVLIGVILGGVVLFIFWRGPMRVLRLLSQGRS